MKAKLKVTGMMCAGCASTVEKEINKLIGVSNVQVSLLTNSATADVLSEEDIDKIIKVVDKSGYKAERLDENVKKNFKDNKHLKSSLIKLILSTITLLVLMYISMAHMFNWYSPVSHYPLLNVSIQLVLTLIISAFYLGIFKRGYKALFKLHPNMDSLVAIGSSAALIFGIYNLIMIATASTSAIAHNLAMNIYFEAAAMIIVFVSLGNLLEEVAKSKTKSSLQRLVSLAPDFGMVQVDTKFVETPIELIKVGDIVRVNPGAKVALDGIVVEGYGDIDESAITGEANPKHKDVGDEVIGASINRNGSFLFRVTKVGQDTTLAKIIKLVEEASTSKIPLARLADKISGFFVPLVFLISIITAIVWIFVDRSQAFNMAISVLVVSCPCALGLATPVAVMVGTGKGAENGILIRKAVSLEKLRNVDTVVLDKTGTITNGFLQVDEVVFPNDDLKEHAGKIMGLEALNDHPLSLALIKYLESKGYIQDDNVSGNYIPGKGMVGDIDNPYVIGNLKLLKDYQIIDSIKTETVGTYIYVGYKNKLIGLFVLTDDIKTDSENAINQLKEMGKQVILLTGDNLKNANYLAKKLNINRVYAEVLPEDKVRIVKELIDDGHKVAMVGDGINDAPALQTSDVGIAIGSGTQIALESADIILMNDSLLDVVKVINLSRIVVNNIKWNLFWAFFYNFLMLPLAVGALVGVGLKLTPMYASLFMSISSIFVVINALSIKLRKLSKKNARKSQ